MTYSIRIEGMSDPKIFVNDWSKFYPFNSPIDYKRYIGSAIDDKTSFYKLFQWKNGTGETVRESKLARVDSFWAKVEVLRKLRRSFSWDSFEKEFQPTNGASVWKLFLLHLLRPEEFPIYDQHVYRFYHFYQNGDIKEIPKSGTKVYNHYKNVYKNWFNDIGISYNLNPKMMDEAFFAYGKMLKSIRNTSYEIIND